MNKPPTSDEGARQITTNLSLHLALFHRTVVRQYLERRTPFLQLHLPIQHHARRNHDQVWTPDALLAGKVRQQSDRLDRLSEPHLVSQNPVEAVLVHRRQPVQSHVLVLPQRVPQ